MSTPSWSWTAKRSLMAPGGRSSTSLTPSVWWDASASRQQPGLLGQERVDAVAGDDHRGVQLGPVAVGADPDHPSGPVAHQSGGHGRGHQSGPGLGGLAGQPRVEVAPEGGHPVVGSGSPGIGAVVDGQRLGAGHHHGGASDHPPLDRHLLPPSGDDLVEHPPVDDAAVDVLRPGEGTPLDQDHRPAGAGQGQGGRGSRPGPPPPPRRRTPGPQARSPPTAAGAVGPDTEAAAQLGQQPAGVGHQAEVGHGRHRARRIEC